MQTIRIVLVGVGNLGRRFCEIVAPRQAMLAERYGLALRLVGAADSRGAAYDPAGLDWEAVAHLKAAGMSIAAYPEVGRARMTAIELVTQAEADMLLEASPVNLAQGGEPGLTCVRTALQRGWHVVTPNKGPLVLAYQELHALAAEHGVKLRFDGTVAGGLPLINVGQRDLRGAVIEQLEAVPNLVTGYIMDLLSEGLSREAALARAREEGVLEADASWDLDGWDAAAKLTILANAVLDYPARLEEVSRVGIMALRPEDLLAARERGYCYRLLAQAQRHPDGGYALTVAPVALSAEHPLGQLSSKQLGAVIVTDIYGTLKIVIDEPDPIPSAATMLRDLLDIYLS